MRPLLRALRFMAPYWAVALGAFLSLTLATAANLVSPQLIQRAIDDGIAKRDFSAILIATGALLVVALLRGLFMLAQGYLSEQASQGAAYDLRNLIYGKLQTLSFSFHDQAQTGQLMTRVTSDVEMVRQFSGQGFLQLLGAIVSIAGTATVLLIMNWRLALVTLPTLPLIFVVFGAFIRQDPSPFHGGANPTGHLEHHSAGEPGGGTGGESLRAGSLRGGPLRPGE